MAYNYGFDDLNSYTLAIISVCVCVSVCVQFCYNNWVYLFELKLHHKHLKANTIQGQKIKKKKYSITLHTHKHTCIHLPPPPLKKKFTEQQ